MTDISFFFFFKVTFTLCCLNRFLSLVIALSFWRPFSCFILGNCCKIVIISRNCRKMVTNLMCCKMKWERKLKERTMCSQGKNENTLLTKDRPGHKIQSLIHYTIVRNSFGIFMKSWHDNQGCNSPQLTSQKIFHRSFVGHSNQVSCCRVLSVWIGNLH